MLYTDSQQWLMLHSGCRLLLTKKKSSFRNINLCQTKISDMVYYMELSQGQIIQKPNKQELSSMFITHCLNVMHASVNFHNIFHTV